MKQEINVPLWAVLAMMLIGFFVGGFCAFLVYW